MAELAAEHRSNCPNCAFAKPLPSPKSHVARANTCRLFLHYLHLIFTSGVGCYVPHLAPSDNRGHPFPRQAPPHIDPDPFASHTTTSAPLLAGAGVNYLSGVIASTAATRAMIYCSVQDLDMSHLSVYSHTRLTVFLRLLTLCSFLAWSVPARRCFLVDSVPLFLRLTRT